jgi:predicted amidohydrolase
VCHAASVRRLGVRRYASIVRVAVVQQAPCAEPSATLSHQARLIRSAADRGARLVVLPEAGHAGFARRHTEAMASAQPLDGPYVEAIQALTASLGIAVATHVYEPARNGARSVVFNTVVVLDKGVLRRTYRKIHLFDAQSFCESAVVEPGDPAQLDELPLDVDGVAVGIATCYDLRFAEMAVALARRGAVLLVVPAAWVSGPGKAGQWEALLRARAIETGSFVAGAAQPGPEFCGRSSVYGPLGDLLGEALGETGEGVVVADVEPAASIAARSNTPTLRHRPVWDAR